MPQFTNMSNLESPEVAMAVIGLIALLVSWIIFPAAAAVLILYAFVQAFFKLCSRNFSDQYGDIRLDIDDMSYEELLALGERIGNVNTGLSEDMISKCLTETKIYSDQNHEERTYCICLPRNATGLVAPAIAEGLGVLTHTSGTLVLMIGASGFATTAAATTIGIVVDSFR